MAVMAREDRTDKRLDDLNGRLASFERIMYREIRAMREEAREEIRMLRMEMKQEIALQLRK